jgi:hypothetical protein
MLKKICFFIIMFASINVLFGMNMLRQSYQNATTSWIANIFRRGLYSGVLSRQIRGPKRDDATAQLHELQNANTLRKALYAQGNALYSDKRILEDTLKINDLSLPVRKNLKSELRRVNLQLRAIDHELEY